MLTLAPSAAMARRSKLTKPRMRTVVSSLFYSVLVVIVPSPACWHSWAPRWSSARRGCPRQPRIRRDGVRATIPYSGRRSSEASGATLHQRRCQAAHVSSRPPLPRPHRTSSARRFWPDPSIRVRRCFAGPYPSYRAAPGTAPSGWLQLHPLRHGTILEVSPERDQQLSRQGDDHDLAQAAPRAAQAIVEPARERATGLVAQPHPGELNERRAQPPVAVLADPLLAVRAAAAVGRPGQPGVGAKRAGVAEAAHEGLMDQHGRGLHADAPHTGEPLDHLLRLTRRLTFDGPVALRFQVGHLLADQVEAIEQPLNLRPSVRGKGSEQPLDRRRGGGGKGLVEGGA